MYDPKDAHYDAGSSKTNPRWDCVDVKFVRKLKRLIPLDELKSDAVLAKDMQLLTGARLSVSGVTKAQWDHILKKYES